MIKKCVCIKNNAGYSNNNPEYLKDEIYEYEYNTENFRYYVHFNKLNTPYTNVSPSPTYYFAIIGLFNKIHFEKFFITENKLRKKKLEKLQKAS